MHLTIVTANPIIAEVLAEELREVRGVSAEVIDVTTVECGEFRPDHEDVVIVTEAAVDRWCQWRAHETSPLRAVQVIGALGSRWSLHDSPEEHGFVGCIDFKWPARDLVRELDGLRRGRVSRIEMEVKDSAASTSGPVCHDDIDRRIVAYITMGLSDRDIGAKVFLSSQTVRNRVSRMLERLHVQNRTQLAMVCVVNPELMRPHRHDEESTPRSDSMAR